MGGGTRGVTDEPSKTGPALVIKLVTGTRDGTPLSNLHSLHLLLCAGWKLLTLTCARD